MSANRHGKLRSWRRAAVLFASLSECLVDFLLLRLRGVPDRRQRALWLHRSCRLVLRRLGFSVSLTGPPPSRGLLVSNHLSYLDVLFYGATLPCVFVAKSEMRRWPLLGLLAALGGTVFIDRHSALSAARAAAMLEEMLLDGLLVLVFPEGTSSDGSTVLHFHPSLFEPAVRTGAPAACAAIRYSAGPTIAEQQLCYYGNISFAPHLLRTLALSGVRAQLSFFSPIQNFTSRKDAAARSRLLVIQLRKQLACSSTEAEPRMMIPVST